MYKLLISGIFLMLFCGKITAQVGINTYEPKAQLDIYTENPNSPEPTDGILIPRISNFPATNPSAQQHGMLVFFSSQKG
ncbi:hypothetical protein V5739_13350 [Salinimicrobium sp. TIG7-5_MAKvit]|uniref:hypothetical protein n=1 Tax=Salinimicrobium sp. TIG7-5_MAKvit TaxID=3121289 RepID=UPI003C6DC071